MLWRVRVGFHLKAIGQTSHRCFLCEWSILTCSNKSCSDGFTTEHPLILHWKYELCSFVTLTTLEVCSLSSLEWEEESGEEGSWIGLVLARLILVDVLRDPDFKETGWLDG